MSLLAFIFIVICSNSFKKLQINTYNEYKIIVYENIIELKWAMITYNCYYFNSWYMCVFLCTRWIGMIFENLLWTHWDWLRPTLLTDIYLYNMFWDSKPPSQHIDNEWRKTTTAKYTAVDSRLYLINHLYIPKIKQYSQKYKILLFIFT